MTTTMTMLPPSPVPQPKYPSYPKPGWEEEEEVAVEQAILELEEHVHQVQRLPRRRFRAPPV
jgi:hypothetical protein